MCKKGRPIQDSLLISLYAGFSGQLPAVKPTTVNLTTDKPTYLFSGLKSLTTAPVAHISELRNSVSSAAS
jgi:hypothetical protein